MGISRNFVMVIIALAVTGASIASQPGEPIDCEEWVSLEPGLSCELVPDSMAVGAPAVVDNTGFFLIISRKQMSLCGGGIQRYELWRSNRLDNDPKLTEGDVLIGYLQERCVDPDMVLIDQVRFAGSPFPGPYRLWFDHTNGTLHLPLVSTCNYRDGVQSRLPCEYWKGWTARIRGFASILDVVPEGLPGMIGPTGPQGPQGEVGMDADESRVSVLEARAAAQQAEIDALRTTLEQVESLPTIQRLLEKVQQLEAETGP